MGWGGGIGTGVKDEINVPIVLSAFRDRGETKRQKKYQGDEGRQHCSPYPNCPKVMFSWKLRSSVMVSLAAELKQQRNDSCNIIISASVGSEIPQQLAELNPADPSVSTH